jgi:Phage major capsid protein E
MLNLPNIFNAVDLTNVLNMYPNQYDALNNSSMFPFVGMSTPVAAIQRNTTGLNLVQSGQWCGPANATNTGKKREVIMIQVPHTEIIDAVTPCDISGRQTWDLSSGPGLMTLQGEVQDRQISMRAALEQTLEYRKIRALYGEILDADGSIMTNLFTTFGYTPKNIEFTLSNPAFDVRAACMELKRHLEKNFKGRYTGVDVVVTSDFMDALTGHASVIDVYKRCCDTQGNVTGDVRNSFTYGGVRFWEYTASGSYVNSAQELVSVDFMAKPLTGADKSFVEGVAYVTGSTNTFETLGAPPQTTQEVNTKATQTYYSQMEPKCFNKGFDLMMEMNALPINKQPNCTPRILLK